MKKAKARKLLLFSVVGIASLCLLATGITWLSNAGLPSQSQTIEVLSESQKAYLEEALHLRRELGGGLWEGWGEVDIPLIVYNESYAFLIGFPEPPPGWVKVPAGERRGTTWELVADDTFLGEAYYRQPLPDPTITPEAFTVLVGEQWVATLPTYEFMEIGFYRDFRDEIPGFIQPVFPYRLVYGLIMGSAEVYIGALNHEAFHAYQGMNNPERLALAEQIMFRVQSYPFGEAAYDASWKEEMELVLAALEASTDDEALNLAQQYLQHRETRRQVHNLSADEVEYERQREWLEGLAKYTELALGSLAGSTSSYSPVSAMDDEPRFSEYSRAEAYWRQQLTESTASALRSGDSRFYYSGLVQAALLDRLSPGWRSRVLTSDLALEDLLRELIKE